MKKRQSSYVRSLLLGALAILSAILPAPAASSQVAATRGETAAEVAETVEITGATEIAAASPATQGPTDPAELQHFLDPIFAKGMSDSHIPGAVFLLVKDGQVLFAKGYGYANLGDRVPVTPDKTIFHVNSISKLFTATAIMQLVETGKVNLHSDVNKYLHRFRIPDAYPNSVTVDNLLTHTAGFDDDQQYIGTRARTPADISPLGAYLSAHTPSPMWPPGEKYLYSNAAYSVLGDVVEEVTGQSFADYAAQHILQPLGMSRSSFQQPAPLASEIATTYEYAGGTYKSLPPPYFNNPPPRALTATATDMSHFMVAQLQDGQYGGTRILQPGTVANMQHEHFTYQEGVPLMAYGFHDAGTSAERILWQNGEGTHDSTSTLVLMPAAHLGLFLAYNAPDDSGFLGQVLSQFYDHYYPAHTPMEPIADPVAGPAAARVGFAGVYRDAQYPHRTIAKLLLLKGNDYPQVVAEAKGQLGVRWSPHDPINPPALVETRPRVFLSQDSRYLFAFIQDKSGNIAGMEVNGSVYEKVPWYERAILQQGLAAFLALAFLAILLGGLVLGVRRIRRSRPAGSVAPFDRLAFILLVVVGGLNLLFLVTLFLSLSQSDALTLEYGMPPALQALLVIPLVTTVLAVGLVVISVEAWARAIWPPLTRICYSLGALAALAFVPYLAYWNLLGFQW